MQAAAAAVDEHGQESHEQHSDRDDEPHQADQRAAEAGRIAVRPLIVQKSTRYASTTNAHPTATSTATSHSGRSPPTTDATSHSAPATVIAARSASATSSTSATARAERPPYFVGAAAVPGDAVPRRSHPRIFACTESSSRSAAPRISSTTSSTKDRVCAATASRTAGLEATSSIACWN